MTGCANDTGWRKFYVPEIHDVAPGLGPGWAPMAAEFPPEARAKIACLVVPNWQDRLPIAEDPTFLRTLSSVSGTMVLHGWTHSRGPDFVNWLLYGHDNRAEFAGLGPEETKRRLDLGRAAWTSAFGRTPDWFCAPRWQNGRHTVARLQADGFAGCMNAADLHVFGRGRVPLPALNFDEGARAWKRALAGLHRAGRIRLWLALERPFRFALHPDDFTYPGTLRQIRRTLRRVEDEGWRPLSLGEAVDQWFSR